MNPSWPTRAGSEGCDATASAKADVNVSGPIRLDGRMVRIEFVIHPRLRTLLYYKDIPPLFSSTRKSESANYTNLHE